jgi:hypothetical protein
MELRQQTKVMQEEKHLAEVLVEGEVEVEAL